MQSGSTLTARKMRGGEACAFGSCEPAEVVSAFSALFVREAGEAKLFTLHRQLPPRLSLQEWVNVENDEC